MRLGAAALAAAFGCGAPPGIADEAPGADAASSENADASEPAADAAPVDAGALVHHPGPCWIDHDELADVGQVDDRETYSYDDLGNAIRIDRDDPFGGPLEVRTLQFFDGGRLLLTDVDNGAEGVIDERTLRTYDPAGRILWQRIDTDMDREPETTWTYEYQDDVTTPCSIPFEVYDICPTRIEIMAADAVVHEVYLFTVEADRYQIDAYYDDYEFARYTFIHGEDLLLDRVERSDGDGPIDYVQLYRYDGAGNLLSRETDNGVDGVIDFRRTYTYDSVGNLLVVEWDDEPADEAIDDRFTYSYDCYDAPP